MTFHALEAEIGIETAPIFQVAEPSIFSKLRVTF